jgi:spore cortex formation protein SpoVR/YcgB (stage V sporulation)
MKKCDNPFLKDDWTQESLQQTWDIVRKHAEKEYGLTFYNPHFEIVSFEDMLHIYTGSLPIMYDHWSFGKSYEELHKRYMADRMGVAYEVIFNTSPALCYLLEHNSPTMQGLVMAHASIGHSAFFRNNELFKEMTNARTIMPFLKNSKEYIRECEEKHGAKEVEKLLDVCHSLSLYAIDRMPHKEKSYKEKQERRLQRILNKDKEYDKTVETIKIPKLEALTYPSATRLREENILKFIGKFSPSLKPWQREIISIYCKIQQYLYPQMQTKLMNEGFASFWHHTIMSDLADKNILPPGGMLEFLNSHCSVLRQPGIEDKRYYGINPYKLGFEIFKDIQRICQNPTEEDKEWAPNLIGKNWIEEVKFAAYNFKDSSFILQYLSPKLIRDFRLLVINDNEANEKYSVSDIHDDEGYKNIRNKLSQAYDFSTRLPDLFVEGWDARRSRTLYIVFQEKDEVALEEESAVQVLQNIKYLWPFNITLKWRYSDGTEEVIEKAM